MIPLLIAFGVGFLIGFLYADSKKPKGGKGGRAVVRGSGTAIGGKGGAGSSV